MDNRLNNYYMSWCLLIIETYITVIFNLKGFKTFCFFVFDMFNVKTVFNFESVDK